MFELRPDPNYIALRISEKYLVKCCKKILTTNRMVSYSVKQTLESTNNYLDLKNSLEPVLKGFSVEYKQSVKEKVENILRKNLTFFSKMDKSYWEKDINLLFSP